MYKQKELNEIGAYLSTEKIYTDSILFERLKLNDKNKTILIKWIQYQALLAEQLGFEVGQDDIRFKIKQLLTPNREE